MPSLPISASSVIHDSPYPTEVSVCLSSALLLFLLALLTLCQLQTAFYYLSETPSGEPL